MTKPEPEIKPRPHWRANLAWGSTWRVERKLWAPNPGVWYWGEAICECRNEYNAKRIATLLETYQTGGRPDPINRVVMRVFRGERWVRVYDLPIEAVCGDGEILCIDCGNNADRSILPILSLKTQGELGKES